MNGKEEDTKNDRIGGQNEQRNGERMKNGGNK